MLEIINPLDRYCMNTYMEAAAADGGGLKTAMERKTAEVDTSSPFRSVREAVLLFGDTLLARQLYPNNASHQKEETIPPKLSSVRAELEETKQRLQKAKEESFVMATCLSSLQDELRRTRAELHLLKQQSQRHEPEEDLKFIEAPTKIDLQLNKSAPEIIECDNVMKFEKKKYVSFSRRHHFPAREDHDDVVLERHPSLKKKKKRPALIPLMAIGGIFSRKKAP